MFAIRYADNLYRYYYDSQDWYPQHAELFDTEEDAKDTLRRFLMDEITDYDNLKEWQNTAFEIVDMDSLAIVSRFKAEVKDPLTPIA